MFILTEGPAGPAGPGLPGSPRAPAGPSLPRAPWAPASPCVEGKQRPVFSQTVGSEPQFTREIMGLERLLGIIRSLGSIRV